MHHALVSRRFLFVALVALLVLFGGCSAVADSSAELGFEDVTEESGLDYADAQGSETGVGNAGVYAADVDDDGWQDVLTIGDEPVLWTNTGGEFERSNQLPDIDGKVKSATFLDYDGDGWDDLVLFRTYDEPVTLTNDNGTFERADLGLGNLSYPLGGTTADYDGDGDQDLFVYQSGDWSDGKPRGFFSPYGTVQDDNGYPNVLYENTGTPEESRSTGEAGDTGGEFERVDGTGIEGERWSLAASFTDLDGDGRPDVHVANDYNNDVIFVNNGDGTFEERLLGNETARNGMASEVADVNGDGRPDVFTTNVELPFTRKNLGNERYERLKDFHQFVIHSNRTRGNTLLINQGDGTFQNQADEYGVRVGGWGWAASFADFNNDGQRDLIHGTQNVVQIFPDDPVYTYPMVWERDGDSFERINGSELGLNEDDSRGLITVDYDNDGDLEVISANYASNFTVYDNTVPSDTSSLEFEVVDENGATVHGATVEVEAGKTSQTVFQDSRTDFLSQMPRRSHVGLGSRERATLRVTWPDGTERTFEDVEAGQFVLLTKDGVETASEFEE